jgi:hypothetical protein
VDSLGPVRHLVSPNKLHQLYLQEWKTAYPQSTTVGAANDNQETTRHRIPGTVGR